MSPSNAMKKHPSLPPLFAKRRLVLAALCAVPLAGCGGNDSEQELVEKALDAFAQDLSATPIKPAELPARIRAYLTGNPSFFGSTVVVLDTNQKAATSPYVFKRGSGYAEMDLVEPGYEIDNQGWLAPARNSKSSTWTAPYFDAGGGDIWMKTRTVPLLKDGVVYALVTTDLPTKDPSAK
jgi:DNA-binding response OmpR family regulator